MIIANKDKYGVKLKYPERSCTECKKYPCFNGFEKCVSDFASYGCVNYEKSRKKRK